MTVKVPLALVFGAVALAGCSAGSNGHGASDPTGRQSATLALRAAAQATADAHSLTFSVLNAQVVYQAPDTVQQVEHGEASIASSSGDSTGPFAQTITKIFIGDRYYEADTRSGEAPIFYVAPRCPSDGNAAASQLLFDLRAMASRAIADRTTAGYSFRIPPGPADSRLVPTSGVATLQGGYVSSLRFDPQRPPAWVITSVNHSSPVTAPRTASPMNLSCSA